MRVSQVVEVLGKSFMQALDFLRCFYKIERGMSKVMIAFWHTFLGDIFRKAIDILFVYAIIQTNI